MNITILDVNNKAPYFESGLYSTPYHVLENSPIGFEIAAVQANDQDISANLHYSIDNKISIARNELGVQMQMKGNQALFKKYTLFKKYILFNNIMMIDGSFLFLFLINFS